jgi:5,10-methenyltetrahydrofolate synthetase
MFNEFKNTIGYCDIAIIYKPMEGEECFEDSEFPISIPSRKIILTQDRHEDPCVWAEKCMDIVAANQTYVLIPGSKFDRRGVRYGKGGGWYDRFLSTVPRKWIRIGVTNVSNLSENNLIKQDWDQVMDWLVVNHGKTWEIIKCH